MTFSQFSYQKVGLAVVSCSKSRITNVDFTTRACGRPKTLADDGVTEAQNYGVCPLGVDLHMLPAYMLCMSI